MSKLYLSLSDSGFGFLVLLLIGTDLRFDICDLAPNAVQYRGYISFLILEYAICLSVCGILLVELPDLLIELIGKRYAYARPGLEHTPWNTKEVTVTDPFGNRLTFFEAVSSD